MKKSTKFPKNPIHQAIFVVIFAIFAVVTWFNNEKKSSPSKPSEPTKSELSIPNKLGNYDTVMAKDKYGANPIPFDYYMLSLSWSPAFCEYQQNKNQGKTPEHLKFQCENQAKFGWVIHGLWPQNANATSVSEHPRFCQGDLPALPESVIKAYMPEAPGASLLQGQWEKHGSCAFDNAESYFAKQKALFRSLNLPAQDLSHKELFQWMKRFNPQLKNAHLRASKNELYICYDKQWNVMDCPR